MAWPTARYKTAANGGSWIPADMNGVQDQYIRSAGIERDDLETAAVQHAGLTTTAAAVGGAAVRRGKSMIVTSEARTNTAYGTHTTPDQVTGIVLPTDGLLCVAFQALASASSVAAGSIAVFLGSDQLKAQFVNLTGPRVVETNISNSANTFAAIGSTPSGLVSTGNSTNAATTDVTTGQLVGRNADTAAPFVPYGGPIYIFAAAGTYTVSIQTKSSSGSVTLKERKLWVWTIGF